MDLSSFKDPELARGLIHSIEKWAPEHATLMEVCGTHTVAIARNGLRTMMPEGVRLHRVLVARCALPATKTSIR